VLAMKNSSSKRDRSGTNFLKRWRTFTKNGFEVHRDYHADVYISLRRNGQTFEFISSDNWPMPPEDLVKLYGPCSYLFITKNNNKMYLILRLSYLSYCLAGQMEVLIHDRRVIC